MEKKSLRTIYGLLFLSGPAVRLVNLITIYRIITFPLIIVFIFTGRVDIFKWLLLVSFSTDAVDGYLARKYKAVSVLGAKLDSIGDDLTVLAGLIALFKTYPDFIREESVIVAAMIVLYFVQLGAALFRYGKPTSFHTYSAKLAAVLQGCFLLVVFLFSALYPSFFYVAAAVTAYSLIEETIMVSLLPQWQADIKGWWWALKLKERPSQKTGPKKKKSRPEPA